ncbi:MAG TPA: hypothetical protein VNX21_00605, partial [Candidatus Thermoplasmatota archaeon]|nr:hypothetical protein [Candidatus Thermoplasmatota archaeon]
MPSSTPCVREPMRFAHLLLPLLLAGCIQGGAPSAPGDAVAPAAAPDAAAAPPALGTNATAEAPVVTIVAVSYEGRTRTSACVPSGPNACRGAPGAMPGENEWYFVEAEGVPQG